MAAASISVTETPLVLYALRRADDALILGHRLSEWCGHAPALEEDMALANMGLDLLGQARELYSYAADVEGQGNDEDKFAYLRDVRQYRNLLLLEQPNGDFARTMARQFFYAAFADLYWRAMMKSTDATLAAIAAKSEKESAYHLRHSSEWMVRLGDGTEESHRRAQGAVDDLWAYTGEMFGVDESERALIAQITRYHRKGIPKLGELASVTHADDEALLDRCAVILRLAEHLERGRDQSVSEARLHTNGDGVDLHLKAGGDLTLPRWSVERYGDDEAFERVFQRRLLID